jgi:PilZ domain
MATQLELLMTKTPVGGGSAMRTTSQSERRVTRRCKITQLMRLRPSDPEKVHFEDLRGSLSVSRNGVFFQTSEPGYEIGMRLFVTMPYSKDPTSMSREYLAEVVRRENMPNGLFGVGFKILMEMGLQGGFTGGYSSQRK